MRIGIDLGGTKIEAIVLSDDGSEVHRQRMATPQGSYAAILDAIVGLVRNLEEQIGHKCSIGIGIPGALSRANGRVKNANSTCLIGHQLDKDIEARLGRPIRLANDANCFALSEAMDGAGAGAETVFGVILGTGVGGGLIHRQEVLGGRNAIAGEWGHNPLPWPNLEELPGPRCYCGKEGCIETFLSGPSLVRDWLAHGGNSAGVGELPDNIGAEAVVTAAEAGEAAAEEALKRYEDRLARGLAHVINIFDPEVIVLGGGLSHISRLYDAMDKLLPIYVFSDRVDTLVRPPRHGDSSGVRGAAWLWALGN